MKTKTSKLPMLAGQHGFIMLALLLILVITGSTFVLAGLNNRQSTYLKDQKELHVQMEAAKAALLAYAANSATLLGNLRGPGYFPCPATSANDADGDGIITDSSTAVCSSTIGRLPEAVDIGTSRFILSNAYAGIDEQFWYVVGPRYTNTSASTYNATRIASRRASTTDTNATNFRLYLDGVSEYVALIIAPGEALGTQNRTSNKYLYSNYLDGQNGASSYNFYTSYASNPAAFNDQVIGITLDEYIRAIGPKVMLEFWRELEEYYTSSYPTSSGYTTFPNAPSPSTAGQSGFRNIFNYSASNPADMPIWLRNTTNTTNGNGERWPFYTYYTRDNVNQARIVFQGCPGMVYTVIHTTGITLPAQNSSC